MDKPLNKLTKGRKRKFKIIKIRDGRGILTTDIEEIHVVIRAYFKNICSSHNQKLKRNR